ASPFSLHTHSYPLSRHPIHNFPLSLHRFSSPSLIHHSCHPRHLSIVNRYLTQLLTLPLHHKTARLSSSIQLLLSPHLQPPPLPVQFAVSKLPYSVWPAWCQRVSPLLQQYINVRNSGNPIQTTKAIESFL